MSSRGDKRRFSLAELLYWIAFLAISLSASLRIVDPARAVTITFVWIGGTLVTARFASYAAGFLFSVLCGSLLTVIDFVFVIHISGGQPLPATVVIAMGVIYGMIGGVIIDLIVMLAFIGWRRLALLLGQEKSEEKMKR